MAKTISVNSVPHLTQLISEYNQYGTPFLVEVLKNVKAGAKSPNDYQTRIAKGIHLTGRTTAKTAVWLKFCIINPNYLSKIKTKRWMPRNSHQKCVSTTAITGFVDALQSSSILSKTYKNFEQLYDDVNALRCPGLGDLFVYDAALRIAYDKKVLPRNHVYLHSGALTGAKLLEQRNLISLKPHLSAWRNGGRHCVPISTFCKLFPHMSSMDIENFLCIAKAYFPTMIVP